jgi:arsenate reductase
MKKIYYLSSCDTCKRIMNSLKLGNDFIKQDLKTHPLNLEQLEELYHFTGSYEALLNKRARLYKERDLKSKSLSEADFKALLLEHYTFLKRPVFIIEGQVFVGNSKTTVAAVAETLDNE